MKVILSKSTGFVYYVSRLGVTGKGHWDLGLIKKRIAGIKKITKKPIAVGFGISSAKVAKQVYPFVDGIIVGSALIDLIAKYEKDPKLLDHVKKFAKTLAASS